jgi:hypothetical protein
MLVQFMFSPIASDAVRKQVIATLTRLGALKVCPAFPDAASGKLERVYSADVADGHEPELLRALNRSEAVDFAEVEAPRWLAAP